MAVNLDAFTWTRRCLEGGAFPWRRFSRAPDESGWRCQGLEDTGPDWAPIWPAEERCAGLRTGQRCRGRTRKPYPEKESVWGEISFLWGQEGLWRQPIVL